MKNRISIFLILILTIVSCSKKETSQDIQKNKTTQSSDNKSNQTPSNASSFYSVKNIDSEIKKNELVNFTWSENGQDKKLSDYKGKVILLNFWATWCGPCKRELPDLSQLAKDLSGKDFKLIGVSVDENPLALENFLKNIPLSYTVLSEPASILYTKYMDATGGRDNVIPQTYIIDKNGKVVETLIGTRNKGDFLKLINKCL